MEISTFCSYAVAYPQLRYRRRRCLFRVPLAGTDAKVAHQARDIELQRTESAALRATQGREIAELKRLVDLLVAKSTTDQRMAGRQSLRFRQTVDEAPTSMKAIGFAVLLALSILWLAVAWLLHEDLGNPGARALPSMLDTRVRSTSAAPPMHPAVPQVAPVAIVPPATATAPRAAPTVAQLPSPPNALPVAPTVRILPGATVAIDVFAEGGPTPIVVGPAPYSARTSGASDEGGESRSGESR